MRRQRPRGREAPPAVDAGLPVGQLAAHEAQRIATNVARLPELLGKGEPQQG
jgi:hypothetical protein